MKQWNKTHWKINNSFFKTSILTIFVDARRRLFGDVHDGRPEEVLRRNEENGKQETSQSHSKT